MTDEAQVKKGLGVWAWVAIGCGVVILIGGIIVVAGTVFVAKKAKSYAEEMEKNPGLTAARTIVKFNPELEEVSNDPEEGTITVRNTKTGEVVTVDFDQLKEGKLSFSSGDKKVAIDATGEGVNITSNEDGKEAVSLSTGNRVTEEIPSWVPVFDDAQPADRSLLRHSDGLTGGFKLAVTAAPADVIEFYRAQLKDAGFSVSVNTYSGDDGNGGVVNGKLESPNRTVVAIIGADDNGSTVAVSYTESS
jgi:hypothetical protein